MNRLDMATFTCIMFLLYDSSPTTSHHEVSNVRWPIVFSHPGLYPSIFTSFVLEHDINSFTNDGYTKPLLLLILPPTRYAHKRPLDGSLKSAAWAACSVMESLTMA